MRANLFNKRWLSGETISQAEVNGITVEVEAGSDEALRARNVRSSMKRVRLSRFHEIKYPNPQVPLAIVGGGPTAAKYLDEIKKFEQIMVVGTAHDWAREQGLDFRLAVIYEPDPRITEFMKRIYGPCAYLASSTCAPETFDLLEDQARWISIWHPAGDVNPAICGGEPQVGGGGTVMLRAIPLAVILGYSDLHLFGFDSCFIDHADHAYVLPKDLRREAHDNPIGVKADNRQWSTTMGWLAQGQQFVKMQKAMGEYFQATIHGDNLTRALVRGT